LGGGEQGEKGKREWLVIKIKIRGTEHTGGEGEGGWKKKKDPVKLVVESERDDDEIGELKVG